MFAQKTCKTKLVFEKKNDSGKKATLLINVSFDHDMEKHVLDQLERALNDVCLGGYVRLKK